MLRSAEGGERDVYANLLRDSRQLAREHAAAREQWFEALPWERKEETLFELEMTLKGLVCLGNPRNTPGPPQRPAAVARDYVHDLRVLRLGLEHAGHLVRQLLGERDRAYAFSRYLESVLPEDGARAQLVRDQLSQDTPEEALFLLRNAFASQVDLADGLLRLGRVSHRMFHALHSTVTREVGRNVYFNPLVALEFRPEFDRIRVPEVLEALAAVRSEAAHRVTALTLLALFRALRYVRAVDAYAASGDHASLGYVALAVLRSDLRALSRFLSRRAGGMIADGFEQELLSVPARDLVRYEQALHAQAAALVGLRSVLETVAGTLRIELKRSFERELPPIEEGAADAALGPQLVVVAAQLRATVQHAVHLVCAEVSPRTPLPELARDDAARRAASDRLRRDVWMFSQILRAFVAKAEASRRPGTVALAPARPDAAGPETAGPDTAGLDAAGLDAAGPDAASAAAREGGGALDDAGGPTWSGPGGFGFVREFLQHFRAIGYQLVRLGDYERLDPFLDALAALRDVDLLDRARLDRAVAEARALQTYLDELFQQIGRRQELAGVPFARKEAAETLRIYLGAS
jgi:hypothetical protein